MAKRVKKGFRMELRDGASLLVAYDLADKLRLEDSSPHAYGVVYLTAEACEALGITAALEDVPEPKTPGERLGDVLGRMGFHGATRQQLELAAAALGIKLEGES